MDMRFFAATSNLLASADQAGYVFVRKVNEDSPEAGIQVGAAYALLRVAYVMPLSVHPTSAIIGP